VSNWTLREPAATDWPAVLQLASASLADMPMAPPQDEWLANRRAYLQGGKRHHVVAVDEGRIAGYAAAEHAIQFAPGEFRVFVVVAPADRETLGTYLLGDIRRYLIRSNARSIRMLEYEADSGFLAFLSGRGFVHRKTFAMADGVPLADMRMDAPFGSLG
jgi:hypothetical protein